MAGIGPMRAKDTGPPMRSMFRRLGNAFPITGVTITYQFLNVDTGRLFTGGGRVVVVDGLGGIADYYFDVADTTVPGLYNIYPNLIDPVNGKLTARPQSLEILPQLTTNATRSGMGRMRVS